ncbi:MAG TPA: glycosyl transferase family protein [Bryobacteraceae bacterium]|nr:glycosyl transferase family protein [Bryobacteraceae bacterium]
MPGIFAILAFASIWPWVLATLACLLLLSGIDDFIPVLICVCHRWHRRCPETDVPGDDEPDRRIAIFVPCWKEADVIGGMVRSNLARIRYSNFDFFIGVYPNDQPTCDAALDVAAGIANVHVVVCPNAGPTSKADCLNAIYHGMVTFEDANRLRFDTIVLHDAEDVIHADALSVINRERRRYEMVQVPVLPLPTPPGDFTHGIYCDEFAEFQLIDMHARQYSKSFVPSNGVGTGFSRDTLERLAAQRGAEIFDQSSLTEDYDIGVQIHLAGLRQLFFRLERGPRGIIATREYFPRKVRTAIRQRTRWITGIALQSWERHGWRGSLRTRYWFWRDRKGLLTNPLSLLTNLVFLAGVTDWLLSLSLHRPWLFAVANRWVVQLCVATACLQVFRLILRSVCVGRLFGVAMAATVALRCFHTNFINCAASMFALRNYLRSRLRREALPWAKTDHSYPVLAAMDVHRADLNEVLVKCGYISQDQLAALAEHLGPEEDLVEFLLTGGFISEHDLCRAMSLQSGLPWSDVDIARVNREVLRNLPVRVQKDFNVLPFRVSAGRLHVATTRVPEAHVFELVSRFTRLSIEFQLVTRLNYAQLRELL